MKKGANEQVLRDGPKDIQKNRAGIFEQSMRARNRIRVIVPARQAT
jgi:hypothetical protein